MRVEARFRGRSLGRLARRLWKEPSQLQKARAAARLSKLLRRVGTAKDLGSFANPFFMRKVRLRLFGEMLRLVSAATPSEVRIYHLASAKWRFAGDQLHRFEPRKLIESLRSNLNFVSGLKALSGWFIVFVHNDHDSRTDTYSPHFHVLVMGEKRQAFEALRRLKLFKGGRNGSTYKPFMVQLLNDPARQLSYLFKVYWPGKRSWINKKGFVVRGRSRRMEEPRHAESILFLHELGFSDLVWMHGVEVRNGGLELSN